MSALATGPASLSRHLLFVTTPALWPAWPFLPVVRRTSDGEECGLLFDAMGTTAKPGLSATVWFANLFLLPPTFEEFLALRKEVYDRAEELIESGWRVD